MTTQVTPQGRAEIDRLVERVARKSGYVGGESIQDYVQRKFEEKSAKLRAKADQIQVKLGRSTGDRDFTEEIRTYLADGVRDLMAEGHSEEEALRQTQEKFEEAELAPSFDDFLGAFDGFGLTQPSDRTREEVQFYESVGLFYAAFTVAGMVAGALIGFLLGRRTAFGTALGIGAGLGFGVAGGLLANAIMAAKRNNT